jgi:hypothetical protein
MLDSFTEEFHKLANHPSFSQHLHNSEYEIRGGYMLFQLASKLKSDHFRQDHSDGFAEHDCFGFNTTDTPASHTQTINHSGMGVCAYERVRVEDLLVILHDHTGQMLKIDLMDNTGARWGDGEVLEGILSPLEELKTFVVTSKFDFLVFEESVFDSADIGLDRVVNYQIHWDLRIDVAGVLAETRHSVTHGGEVYDRRHAGEVLENYTGGLERNFDIQLGCGFPIKDFLDVFAADFEFVAIADGGLKKHADRVRQFFNAGVLQVRQGEIVERLGTHRK